MTFLASVAVFKSVKDTICFRLTRFAVVFYSQSLRLARSACALCTGTHWQAGRTKPPRHWQLQDLHNNFSNFRASAGKSDEFWETYYLVLLVLCVRAVGWIIGLANTTVPIKSIRRSRVTGLLNLTKSHRGHTKIMKNLKKSSKKDENFLQITIIISEYSNLTKP